MGPQTRGEADGAAVLVLNQIQQLRRRAGALTRNQADAEDLLQDTLERALRALPRLRPESNLGAWLNTMMNHRFIDSWRSGRHTRPLEAAENIAAAEPEPPPPWLEITEAQIKRGIDDLPVSSADILRLRYYRRLSYAEIARRLGITGDTVGTRLFRARRRLKRILIARYLRPTPLITPLHARRPRRRAGAASLAEALRLDSARAKTVIRVAAPAAAAAAAAV
ncbi:MAG TPA: RNA polymerase sigma factor [Polyangia bacterium]|nr:RNA polymerase sigma factor [Polyangia bacterium]